MSRLAAAPRRARSPLGRGAPRRRLIGAAVVALVAAVAVVIAARPDPYDDTRAVRAVFDTADGLGPFEVEVRLAGTPVGRVVSQRRVGDDSVIEMAVERSAGALYADAQAEIRPRTTFEGTAFIELRPGSGPERLGDRPIPRSQTRHYVSISDSLSFLRAPTRDAIRTDVGVGAGVLASPGGDGLREALRVAPRLTRSGALAARAARGRRGDELAGAVRGVAATTSGVAREEQSLRPLVEGSDRTASAIAVDGGAALDRALADAPARLARLRDGSRVVSGIVARTEPLAVELLPGARELPPTLRALRPLLAEARPALAQSPPLLADVRRTLDAAARAAGPARRLADATAPTLELLDDAILPALERETSLGLPTYLQLLSAVQGADGSLRPFQRGNPQGNGHFLRASGRTVGAGAPVPCDPLAAEDPALAAIIAAAGGCVP